MSAVVNLAEERLLRAALRSLMAERKLTDPDSNVRTLSAASDDLRLAAEDLVEAVKSLPLDKQPRRPNVEPRPVKSGAKGGA